MKSSLALLQAQAALVERRALRLGVWLVGFAALGCIAGLAVCGVLAGVVMVIGRATGYAESLLIVSGAVVVVIAIALAAAYVAISRQAERARRRSDAMQEKLSDMLTSSEEETAEPPEVESAVEKAVGVVVSHPKLVSSAVFAVVSVLGVRRSLSLVRGAGALMSAGAVASRVAHAATRHGPEAPPAPPANGRSRPRDGSAHPFVR